jgi:hypothetical protein
MRRALPRRRCVTLAALVLCCGLGPAVGYTPPVIAVVFPTYPARYDLVAAGRDTWRTGVLTVAVTEGAAEGPLAAPPAGAPPSERWFTYPDDARPEAHRRSDGRAIAALRIANASLGGAYECVAAPAVC